MCKTVDDWYRACEYATVYASSVTLLPTHRPETNAVMLRNRRIGVSIIDLAFWKKNTGTTSLIKYLREGYKRIRNVNKWINTEAGVPESIRVTTVKPGGTVPKLPGLVSGWQNPTFGFTLRRVRIGANSPICKILDEAGVRCEPDVFSANTLVYEFPIDQARNYQIKIATEVSLWEQAMTLVMLQREWSDNAVSNTLYFKPKWSLVEDINLGDSFYFDDLTALNQNTIAEMELSDFDYDNLIKDYEIETHNHKYKLEEDQYTNDWHLKVYEYNHDHEEDDIEPVLASIAPLTKSVSLLPHSAKGVYRQMPEEELTEEDYQKRLQAIQKIDWSKLSDSDGVDEKYCEGPACQVAGHIKGT